MLDGWEVHSYVTIPSHLLERMQSLKVKYLLQAN